jgi:hypothetical protein
VYCLVVGVRKRKNHLITVLKARALGGALTPEQVAQFELMYRRAVSVEEQDQVTKVIDGFINGWKTGSDVYSRLRQAAAGLDIFEEDDDPLPPTLQAAWEQSQEFLTKRR